MKDPRHLTILGGGLAGLSTGYHAKKNRLPFTIYEARNRVGGTSITLRHGDFLFDSGAHFFRDKDPYVTKEAEELLGKSLNKINMQVQIYNNGKLIDFPLSPLNLWRNLGLTIFAKVNFELVFQQLRNRQLNDSFESFALQTYGKTIAEKFFLNHSKKLWGLPCNRLSRNISGNKLRPLDLRTLLIEAFYGRNVKTEYLDSIVYYPKMGIGMIADKLAEYCGSDNIITESKITRILHNRGRINMVEINGKENVAVNDVVSTIPINLFAQIMKPKPPIDVLNALKNLKYRDLILTALFLERESVTSAASIHFPDISFPFTRVHEPKNRSEYMSPTAETSLIAEIPSQQDDNLWNLDNDRLIRIVSSALSKTGLITQDEIIDGLVVRLNNAYPVLEIGYEEKIQKILAYLKNFRNLMLTGRTGAFRYISIHDIIKFSKQIIDRYTINR